MQYKQAARVNFGTEAEPDYATIERICRQVVVVCSEDSADKMTVPIRVFETLVTPATEKMP